MGDQFSYGYLGFTVRKGVYYLTGGPIFDADGRRVAGKESTAKGEAKGRAPPPGPYAPPPARSTTAR